jgi:hypothetical protein
MRTFAALCLALVASLARAAVPTTTSIVEYTCNSSQKVFAVTYKFLDASSLRVSKLLIASPYTETVLASTTDYSVAGAGDAGGTVSTTAACATGYKLRIRRLTSRTRLTRFSTSGPFNPAALDADLDRQTMIAQELNDGALVSTQNFSFVGPSADAGVVTASGATTARPLAARFSETVNVKDFGAAGNGVTDDTVAIQAAFAATADGSTIVFPAGSYVVAPVATVQYHDLGAPNGVRKTAVTVTGRKNLTVRGDGTVNIIVNGTGTERVAFFFTGCTNVKIEGLGFGLTNVATSVGGGSILASEDWYPIALEGNDGVEVARCKFVTPRCAVFADSFNGAANKNINVHDSTFMNVTYSSLLTRNASGVRFAGNYCEGTGRNWHTYGEDVALADLTTNSVVSDNRFVNPNGIQSRVTPSTNLGPTAITGNVKSGGGIFVEIYQASNVTVSGNTSTGTGTAEHILFTNATNTANENVSITGNTFLNGGRVVNDYFAGSNTKDGLIFSNNVCQNTYGPIANSARSGVVVTGNRFNLSSSGQEIRFAGQGLVFKGNVVKNGYLSLLDNNEAIVEGNYFLGSFGTPPAVALNISGTTQHTVRGNRFEPVSYTNIFSTTPTLAIGFKFLDAGSGGSPGAMGVKLTAAVGDTWWSDSPVAGATPGWVCTGAGTPGTWVQMAPALSTAGNFSVPFSISPGTPGGSTQGGNIWMGSGVPSGGNNGDVYFRTDTPGTANQRLYVKSAGAWVGIL